MNQIAIEYTPDVDEDLCVAIVNAIEKAKGESVDPEDYVLYDSVDMDALETLFRTRRRSGPKAFEFLVDEMQVSIYYEREVRIEVQERFEGKTRIT